MAKGLHAVAACASLLAGEVCLLYAPCGRWISRVKEGRPCPGRQTTGCWKVIKTRFGGFFIVCGKAGSSGPPVTHHMEEHRSSKADRVETVEHAAVAFDHVAPVLHSAVALDRRHHQATGEAEYAHQQGE